jgi:hypothetical protein
LRDENDVVAATSSDVQLGAHGLDFGRPAKGSRNVR